MAQIPWPEKRRCLWQTAALLVLAGLLMVSTDALARLADDAGADQGSTWWGYAVVSPWDDAVAAQGGLGLTSRDLSVSISGDQLTARYTVTARSGSRLASVVSADDDSNSGNDLVNSALGPVQVGEFRYGLTGSAYSFVTVPFGEPKLDIKGTTATVTIDSQPFRLYGKQQRLEVDRPGSVTVAGPDHIRLTTPSIQVLDLSGARETSTFGNTATLQGKRPTVTATVRDGGAPVGWASGLRSAGGIVIPVADAFLSRLGNMFDYAVLLWAIVAAGGMIASGGAIGRMRRLVILVLTGMGTSAFIGLALDVTRTIQDHAHTRDYVFAGPVGLMIAATMVAWPAAAVRASVSERETGAGTSDTPASKRTWVLGILMHVVLGAAYLGIFRLLAAGNGGTVSYWAVVPLTVLAAVLTRLAACIIVADGRLAGWLVSGAMLAFVLAATIGWQLLYYSEHWDYVYSRSEVNVLGKWIYVAASVALAAGLVVVFARAAWSVLERYRPAWRRILTAAISIGIAVAVLSDSITDSGVAAPRAAGLAPVNLLDQSGLFDSVPWLLDWLFVGLVLLLVMQLPSSSDPRPAARVLAVPVALEVFFANWTWLYLPVELALGLVVIKTVALPAGLAGKRPPQSESGDALRTAIAGWQAAEFAGGQRQALMTNSADKLRDLLLTPGSQEYSAAVDAMIAGQQELAAKQDSFRRGARAAKKDAFSRYGEALSRTGGKTGLITGVLLGLIPAAITVGTTSVPADGGSFPVLTFCLTTAWSLGQWAMIGWFTGCFLPLIRGASGAEKAAWTFLAVLIGQLPADLVWNDGQDWINTLVFWLELVAFLLISTVIIDDLHSLKSADMQLSDWVRVHNWRFVVTWSAAVIAAVGTAAATFLSTAATDLGHQTVTVVTTQSHPAASPTSNGS